MNSVMKNSRVLFLCNSLFLIGSFLYAQNLPREMSLSPDGRMLITGGKSAGGFYDSSIIRNVYLEFSQPNYWQLLEQNYTTKKDLLATMIVDGVRYDSVGARFKGMTSYMQAKNSDKKSFNITVDFVREKQDVMGYRTLNLNNSAFDASFLREVFYLHQIRNHIPAAKANFVRLYINGSDWGLYPNIQQINKDFLDEWFLSNDGINWRADKPDGAGGGGGGWGDGTAALNYLGTDTAQYKKYYTLKSSDQELPWEKLVATCKALNTTPIADLPNVLPSYLDIDRTLWFLASEIAFADDDGYVFKGKMDYYVYYEPETGRMTPLEYDGNTVMTAKNASWSPFYNETKANYPLLNKLLSVPKWRQRYLAHLRTIINEEVNPASCNAILDNYKSQIDTIVQKDPKKLSSYSQFVNELPVLKNFIASRRTNLMNNAEVSQIAPVIHTAEYSNIEGEPWTPPVHLEEATVTTRVTSTNGIDRVNLYYASGLVGNFTAIQMYDDGLHDDNDANDGIFGARIPGHTAGSWVRFYIEAASANTAKSVRYFPEGAEHNVFVYVVQPKASTETPVVINELMASNTATVADDAGEFDDWVELYNLSNQTVDLSGYYLTDNPLVIDKWKIPEGTTIPAKGYLIIWADEDGKQGPLHCNFKLSAEGESLMLLNPGKELVDSVHFGKQAADKGYARVPNGTGLFVSQSPTFGSNNNLASYASQPKNYDLKVSLYPNPVRNNFVLEYTLPESGNVSIGLYDLSGRLVKQYVHSDSRPEGLSFEVLNVEEALPSGMYILRIIAGNRSYATTLILAR